MEKQLEFVVDWVKVGKKQKKGHFCGKIYMIPCLVSLCALPWALEKHGFHPGTHGWIGSSKLVVEES